MEKMIQDMMTKVNEFHFKMGIPVNNDNDLPDRSRYTHLIEEINEIIACHDAGDVPGVTDGLVDFIYVAIGALLQMGIPPNYPFDIVHAANMKKRGEKTARHEHDAVKPEGWKPPDFREMFERLEILHQVSPVFVDLTKLRIHKGKNYNGGSVKRSDHFPLGDLSYFQVIWMKACRVRSLVETLNAETSAENRRLIGREINDIMVYCCFWAEYMRGIEV